MSPTSLTYPPEPPDTGKTVAVTWASGNDRYIAVRDRDSRYWDRDGWDEGLAWDDLMDYAVRYERDPQVVLNTVRGLDLEPPAEPRPEEPAPSGALVVAQFGTVYAVRQANASLWFTTEGEGYHHTWPSLMARVFETTGYASWKVLS